MTTIDIIEESNEQNKHRNYRIITSVPILLIAFCVSHFGYNFYTVYLGKLFDFNYIFYYWGVKYTSRPLLPKERYLIYYTLCFIFPILISYLSLSIFIFFRKIKNLYKLIFYWISVFNLTIIFTEVFMLPFLNETNFGLLLSYANLQIYVVTIFYLLFIGLFWFLGFIYVKFLLYSSNTTYYIRYRKRRRKYILQTALIPWFISFLLVLFFYYPNVTIQIFYTYLMTGAFIVIMWFYCYHRRNRNIRIYKHELPKKISPIPTIISIIIYLIYHLVFSSGVHIL